MSEIFHKIDRSNLKSLMLGDQEKSKIKIPASDVLRKTREMFRTPEENTEFRNHFKMMKKVTFDHCYEWKWY